MGAGRQDGAEEQAGAEQLAGDGRQKGRWWLDGRQEPKSRRTTLIMGKTLTACMAWEAAGRRPWQQGRVLGSSSRRGKLKEDDPGSGEDLGSGRDLRPWQRTWHGRLQGDDPGGREESSAAVAGVRSCRRATLAVGKTLAAAGT